MSRLDWEKANRRERAGGTRKRNRDGQRKRAKARAQAARAEFVKRHDLTCFVCKASSGEWAKTGINKRGPWAICVPCVKKKAPTSG